MRNFPVYLIAAVAAVLLAAPLAAADTYTVTRSDDPAPGECLPEDCSLREALTASNASTTVDDLVLLPAALSPYLRQHLVAPFPITDDVELRGEGADRTVVEGDAKAVLFTVAGGTVLISGITAKGGAGGFQNDATLTLRNVSVERNAREGAGGGVQTNGALTVESSFLGFNSTPGISGGAIQANGSVTIVNSTIAHNSSTGVSAVNGNSAVTIASSTVAHNETTGSGAAVRGAPLTVRDSVFAANKNSGGTLSCSSTLPPSLGGNVEDGSSCTGAASDRPNVDPLLGTLATHGGTTPLFDLLAGSPAIDAGSQCPAFDQRGIARPLGAACDSGSYEFVPLPQPPAPPLPPDSVVELRLAKGRPVLTRKGVILLRLACAATEKSPPCAGQVRVRTRKGAGIARTRFRIGAGKTKTLRLKPSAANAELIRASRAARRVQVKVRASDSAGSFLLLEAWRRIAVR